MKIIHTADIHLDSKMKTSLDAKKATLRRAEIIDTFESMIDYADKHGVEIIMIAGDLFDRSTIGPRVARRIVGLVKSYSDITFCYLKGNHDQSNVIEDIVADQEISNFLTFRSGKWKSYMFDDVVITGLELDGKSSDDFADSLNLDESKTNIVMLHGQESEYQVKSDGDIINLSNLRDENIDYLALGHIHSYKMEALDDRGIYCYCGCLEGRGFDECGEKGFVVLDIENGKISTKFVSIAKRTLHNVTVKLNRMMTYADVIEEIISDTEDIASDDLVRVELVGQINEQTSVDLDIEDIEIKALNRFFAHRIRNFTTLAIDYATYKHDLSLKGEFVRIMENTDLSEDRKNEILKLGLSAILGERIEI